MFYQNVNLHLVPFKSAFREQCKNSRFQGTCVKPNFFFYIWEISSAALFHYTEKWPFIWPKSTYVGFIITILFPCLLKPISACLDSDSKATQNSSMLPSVGRHACMCTRMCVHVYACREWVSEIKLPCYKR